MKLIDNIKDIYHKGDNEFYISLIGPLTMGTIHLVSIIIHFDWILLNYMIFFYLTALAKVWQWAIDKYSYKTHHYLAFIISILVMLAPMMAAFVLTIMFKDAPHYIFDWLIYAYALFATIKTVVAIKKMMKKDKNEKEYCTSYLALLTSFYTIQMLEFDLIMTFGTSGDNSMYLLQLFTQGAIFLFTLYVIFLFTYKLHKIKKLTDNNICKDY